MGEISANSSLSPSRKNHSNESRWTLIRLGMGATSLIRANECRAAPSARARETGRASASAMGLLTPPLCAGQEQDRGTGVQGKVRHTAELGSRYKKGGHRAVSCRREGMQWATSDGRKVLSTQARASSIGSS